MRTDSIHSTAIAEATAVRRTRDLGAPFGVSALLLSLARHSGADGSTDVSRDRLARELGVTPRTITRWMRWLEEHGFLEREGHGLPGVTVVKRVQMAGPA